MHASRKRAFEMVLSRAEALAALARLTAEAPSGRLAIGPETVPLEPGTGLKVSLKPLGESYLLRVRLKDRETAPEVSPGGDTVAAGSGDRYKDLKKRMKHSFKAVAAALGAGQAPDPAVLADFVADSRRMVTYPGKGDAQYPAYTAAVDRLEAAVATGDLSAMARAVAALTRMKKECHSRHA